MKDAERSCNLENFVSREAAPFLAWRESWRLERRTLALAALAATLASGVFAGHYLLELQFSHLHAFKQYDVLFDTDPNIRLIGFSHGWGPFNRNLLHPNLANFINPPLRFVAHGLQLAGFGGADLPALREALALLVNPFFSALQAVATLILFLRLGFSRPAAFLLSLFGACTFSQIIFGSIPDHFVLSGVFLTCALILAADLLQRQGTINWPAWLFVGWLTASITISNLAIIGLLFWGALRCCRRPGATRKAAFLLLSVSLLTFASHLLLNLGYDAEPQRSKNAVVWSIHFLRPDTIANFLRFPTALADSIASPEPEVTNIRYLFPPDSRYAFQFTLADTPAVFTAGNILGSAIFLLLLAGAIGHFKTGGTRRGLLWCTLAVIAFNALFHAAWGNEYFLYSQHWLPGAVFLAAGILGHRSRFGPAASFS